MADGIIRERRRLDRGVRSRPRRRGRSREVCAAGNQARTPALCGADPDRGAAAMPSFPG